MAVDLIFSPESEADIGFAYDWYEKQCDGRGEDFLIRLEACLSTISRSPEMYPVVKKVFRRALLRKYPYAVIYEFDGVAVQVIAVFHMSQNPKKWQSRKK